MLPIRNWYKLHIDSIANLDGLFQNNCFLMGVMDARCQNYMYSQVLDVLLDKMLVRYICLQCRNTYIDLYPFHPGWAIYNPSSQVQCAHNAICGHKHSSCQSQAMSINGSMAQAKGIPPDPRCLHLKHQSFCPASSFLSVLSFSISCFGL